MKAIIVAGGRGERLKPITDSLPKPMVVVNGKSILEHTINLLKKNEIKEIIIALCYLPEVVENYFGDGSKFEVNIKYIYENPLCPLGTAGAIRAAKDFVGDDFVVTYADILRDLDLKEMVKVHLQSEVVATLNIYQEFEEVPRSMLVVNEYDELTKFVEHPEVRNSNGSFVWCNGSMYIFNKKIFEYIGAESKIDFSKDIFPRILEDGLKIKTYKSYGYFLDIGTMEKLELARKTFLG